MDDVLKPLVLGLSLSASNPKLGLISISGINKLVSYGAIHEVRNGLSDSTEISFATDD